jgi:predicted phage baseplate assembly protein
VTANTVPLPVTNAAGLSAVRYRIGTFTSFRKAMLDKIAAPDLMTSAVTTLSQAAAATATTIAILDATAFPAAAPFRIKIGTEYLTVTGGAGSTTWTVQRGVSPVAYTVGTPVWLDPVNPFAAWHEGADGDYQTAFVELWAYLADVLTFYQERIANEAFLGTATQRDSLLRIVGLIDYRPSPGAGATGVVAFTVAKGQSLTVPAGFRVGSRAQPGRPAAVFETVSSAVVTGDNSLLPLSPVSPLVSFAPNQVVLRGINTQLAVNDYLLAVENLGDPQSEVPILLRITDIQADKVAGTTTVSWSNVGGQAQQVSNGVALFAFKVVTAAFGARAPGSVLVATAGSPPGVTLQQAPWDNPLDQAFYLPAEGDDPTELFLDGGFDQLKYSAEKPGWVVLLDKAIGAPPVIAHVVDARQMGKVAYSISAKVTRLTLLEDYSKSNLPMRTTTILTGSQRLSLQSALPLPDEVSGTTLVLSGIHPQLQDGQTVVLRGTLFAPDASKVSAAPAAESAVLKGATVVDTDNDVTTVALKNALTQTYLRSSCVLMANVVEITQGETVKDEVLGSGDGSAFQSYPLKQKPLTYLPSSGSDGLAAVSSTLSVTVNGVAWTELPTLVGGAPHDQVFATAQDDSGQTSVLFGDGINGARPPTGANNIHARYRKGLGVAGNLPADAVQRLVDNTPNLQKVTNPLPSSGGEDAAGPSAIRSQAPASLRTFSRAVSAADYAALAMSYPGIAKASAAWVFRDPITSVALTTPYVQLTLATSDGVPLKGLSLAAKLREFLNAHRDPNVLVRIQDYIPVYVQVAVDVAIDARFPHQATLDRVMAALNPGVNADGSAGFFAFEQMQFGQAVYLSALYAAVQAVPGVLSATVTVLRRLGPGSVDTISPAPGDIVVGPTELISIDAAVNPDSQLVITGLGGFADS